MFSKPVIVIMVRICALGFEPGSFDGIHAIRKRHSYDAVVVRIGSLPN